MGGPTLKSALNQHSGRSPPSEPLGKAARIPRAPRGPKRPRTSQERKRTETTGFGVETTGFVSSYFSRSTREKKWDIFSKVEICFKPEVCAVCLVGVSQVTRKNEIAFQTVKSLCRPGRGIALGRQCGIVYDIPKSIFLLSLPHFLGLHWAEFNSLHREAEKPFFAKKLEGRCPRRSAWCHLRFLIYLIKTLFVLI